MSKEFHTSAVTSLVYKNILANFKQLRIFFHSSYCPPDFSQEFFSPYIVLAGNSNSVGFLLVTILLGF